MKTEIDYYDALKNATVTTYKVDIQRPIWIFGAGGFGTSLCKAMQARGIDVSGFVESSPKTNSVMNLPVVNWDTLKQSHPDTQLALGILNRSTPYDELVKIAAQAGFNDVLMPWDTYGEFDKELGWRFWLSKRSFILSGIDRIKKVSECLADKESRDTLMRITAFRLGQDISFASQKTDENQYFNNLTLKSLKGRSVSYVDCGAYNGDTYIDLMSQQGIDCRQALLLEPDPENFNALTSNLNNDKYRNAICLPIAAADKYSILTFNAGQGEGGAIGSNGNVHIAAVSLDEILCNTPVDFVKLDVEGAEAQVIKGARRVIENSRPVLALSLYHNPQDLWELPELVFGICKEYNFYIRQHYYNSFDSVFYAVPK